MPQTALILHPTLKGKPSEHTRSIEAMLEEAVGLAESIHLEVVLAENVPVARVNPATYIGSGQAERYAEFVAEHKIALMIFNDSLSPGQQRNLELALKCKVIDRTALILEIFGQRASTKEGSLQVELAAQEYQKTRLVRSWTHLERQRGGSGTLSGPGETQIESDRRAIRDRIALIKKRIKKVIQTRELQRKARKKVPYDIVALVGYTNAGKSTLFNRLTGADVLAEDKLFATLDPTMRIVKLPSGRKIILSDTVGFISNLPTELVAAFRATLEEVLEANLILHVRDIANPDSDEQKTDVLSVLDSLGLPESELHHMLEVLNKIDLLPPDQASHLLEQQDTLAVSAITGVGTKELLQTIDTRLSTANQRVEVTVPCANGQAIAWIYAHAEVLESSQDEETMHFTLSISAEDVGRLRKLLG